MGDTISSLVYRPPKPTHIDPNEYFSLNVNAHSQICTSTLRDMKHLPHMQITRKTNDADGASCGSCITLDTHECMSDLDSSDSMSGGILSGAENSDIISEHCGIQGDSPETTGFTIPAFYVRRRGANHTILFSHGNAEDLGMMYRRMKDLALSLCVNIMAYDYTGYGLSKGGDGPNEDMIYRNIEAAYKYLRYTRETPACNIILYGRSLGSGPSCYLAAKSALMGDSVGGLILHSPFLSVYKVVADFGFDMAGDLFNNERRARNIRCPTLIIHGKADEIVPFWHAPRLLSAIPPEFRAQPFWVDGLGHNHIESKCRQQYVHVITSFLMKYVPMDTEMDENGSFIRNNINNTSSFDGKGLARRKPFTIPAHERASVESTQDKENSTFYVNQMWVRHAKYLISDAVGVGDYVRSSSNSHSKQKALMDLQRKREKEKKKIEMAKQQLQLQKEQQKTQLQTPELKEVGFKDRTRTRSFRKINESRYYYGESEDDRDDKDIFPTPMPPRRLQSSHVLVERPKEYSKMENVAPTNRKELTYERRYNSDPNALHSYGYRHSQSEEMKKNSDPKGHSKSLSLNFENSGSRGFGSRHRSFGNKMNLMGRAFK